jgi:SAM-dependent methyltransferase
MIIRKSMEKSSYDIEWKVEGSHWWFVVRKKLLKSILSSIHFPSEGVTLDIGCGVGSNLKILESAGLRTVGLDRSIYALTLAKRKLHLPFINGDLNKLPFRSQSVGLIIASDVLEHLENDITGIRECYRVLEKRGILILTVPAFKFLWGIQDIAASHKRRYSRQEILDKLSHEGFDIVRSSYFNFFLFLPILVARRLMHLLGLKIESENEINSPLINFFLKTIFSVEPHLLKYFPLPFGVSIYCIAKR